MTSLQSFSERCQRRRLPLVNSSMVSVTFRRMYPSEFVVRYVIWELAQSSKPLRCSVNITIEKLEDCYEVKAHGTDCHHSAGTITDADLLVALQKVLQQIKNSRSCPTRGGHLLHNVVQRGVDVPLWGSRSSGDFGGSA